MNNYITLTKALFKNGSDSLSMISGKKKKKKTNSKVANTLLIIFLLICLAPLAGLIGKGVWELYGALEPIGQEGIVLGLGFIATSFVIFFFGIFYVINVFYFSRDVENLLYLPLRPADILGAKFTITLFYEYLTELMFLGPVIVAYGIRSGAGVLYWIYSVIIFLTLPIIPLVYASILNLIIMRFTNVGKNKDLFRIIGGFFGLVFALGLNVYIQKLTTSNINPADIQKMMAAGNNSMLNTMGNIFPSSKFAAIATANSGSIQGLVNMLIFLAVTVLFVMLFLFLGEKLYFRGVVGVSEVSSKRKKLSSAQYEKATVQSSAVKTYMFKELKILFRTPIYFINCVLFNFLGPIFIPIMMVAQPDTMKSLGGISVFLQDPKIAGIILAAAFGFISFIAMTNAIAPTAISREGQNVFVCKYLPMSYRAQIMGKVLAASLLGYVGAVMTVLLGFFMLHIPAWLALLILVESIPCVFFCNFVGILIDLNFPKLIWDNEQKAVKQNMNVLYNMVICAAIVGLAVFGVIAAHLGLWMTFIILTAGFGIIDLALYKVVSTVGVRLFSKLEA